MARAPRIIIDAGHGGSERAGNSSAYGARGPLGVVEKDVTLDIARHVVARLGGAAALTRAGDRNLTIGARAARGQRSDVFVSIHANYGAPELTGPEVYVHPEAGRSSRALARRIAQALDRQAGRYGGGSDERRAEMAVLNPSAVGRTAACLVEVDYLSNLRGEQRLGDPGERVAIGAAIASAIQEHLASGLSWDLAEAIRTIEPAIDGTSLSSNQKHRLHDLLRILRDNPNADDHYVNGLDNELQRIGPRLNQAQFDVMTRNRVTADLLRQSDWDSPAHIAESLRLLDERIWHGIQYLARRAATDGGVMSAGLQQLKDWISERQRDPRSIYYAYGELQNRYEGRYGKQLDLRSGSTVESGSLTLQPGLPGHAQLLLSSAHNGGTLGLEGTVSWDAGGPPRAISARFVELASQGIAETDHALRLPADLDVAIPITGRENEPLRWQVPVNPGPARIELTMEATDPETRVRVDWRVVVSPPSPITEGLQDNIRWDVLEQRLRYGCVVHLDVRLDDSREPMSHAYPIDTAGKIKLPMLGLVDALDVSLQTLAERVQNLLTPDFYRSPTVNATLRRRIVSYGANVTAPRLHVRLLDSAGAVQNDSGWYPVRTDGTLNLPHVGSVMARGRRLEEVEAEVQAGYRRDYLINAVVHVTPFELDAT